MAITHGTSARNAAADAVVDAIDAGGAGTLQLQTSGGTLVATLTFGATAFGAASSGVATANAITADPSAAGGTTTKGVIKSGAGTVIINFTVTATGGGGDIELNNTTIAAGSNVSLSSLTYTAAP
jgi:archaellin